MKKLMLALMISGVALMAQTGSAPANSGKTNGSTTPAPTAKVKKHHKAKTQNTAPAGNASSNATNKPASK
jgi:hypothetical protein